jgi:PIN domain nuclease of toxin-antitoxin system
VILLDTHAVIWLANEDTTLGSQSREIISAALRENDLSISAVSFWEIALLVAKNRLELRRPLRELRDDLLKSGVTEVPLTGDLAMLAVDLEDLHADPADRFIAATAVANAALLVTADARLLRWRHALHRQDAQK